MHPHHLPSLFALPFLLLLPPSILALTLPPNTTTSPLTSEITCLTPRYRWNYINVPDCMHALRQLPTTHHPGAFHSGGADDEFRLLKTVSQGDCSVRFQLVDDVRGGVTVESSWLALRTTAAELVWACALKMEMGQTRGGGTTAGARDGIRVSVQKRGTGAVDFL